MGRHLKKEHSLFSNVAKASTLGMVIVGSAECLSATSAYAANPEPHKNDFSDHDSHASSAHNKLNHEGDSHLQADKEQVSAFISNNAHKYLVNNGEHSLHVASDKKLAHAESMHDEVSSREQLTSFSRVQTAASIHSSSYALTLANDPSLHALSIVPHEQTISQSIIIQPTRMAQTLNQSAGSQFYTRSTTDPVSVSSVSGKSDQLRSLDSAFRTINPISNSATRAGAYNYHSVAMRAALSRVGTPYQWGASGSTAFDCSGLMVWSYKQAGVKLPRATWSQMSLGTRVASVANLQEGDLVFYDGGSHVGMYIGNGMIVHSPSSGDHVKIVPVDSMSIYAMRHI